MLSVLIFKKFIQKKCENRQVCAGTLGPGFGTSRLYGAESFSHLVAFHLEDPPVVPQVSALCRGNVTGFVVAPLVREFPVVEVGPVREDEGV